VAKTCGLIATASSHGAELIAFPEVFVPGYPAGCLTPEELPKPTI